MVINGPKATACFGGLGTFVSRGENRVNDLECHANCLRERLDRLEGMLPTALIEASIAIQKGERHPDLLQLTKAEEPSKETQGVELPCAKSECGQAVTADNMIEDYDEPQVCMLQVLARKEKRLRKKIYEMELKEERYKKALDEAGHTLNDAAEASGIKNSPLTCQPQCPGSKNQTFNTAYRVPNNTYDDPVKQRIQELEASSKKISMNLKNLHKERAELTCKAKNLTAELRCTQKCLGEVQQRVLGSSPSQVIPIMGDPSLDYVHGKSGPRCANAGNCATRLPQDPEALKTLAGQFKEAYRKAENEGLSSSVREPIKKTAERLRALSNVDPNACPCGQPIKCDSCVICSCADWERDLEGGGDEQADESSSDSDKTSRGIPAGKHRKESTDRCHCGCNDTSSESECPCGCSEMFIETADICPCSCDQAVESSAISTITETTIPSSETDDSGYSQVGRGDAHCDECNFTGCTSLCEICKNEDQAEKSTGINRKNVDKDQCEICLCETSMIVADQMCTICPCACTTCDVIDEKRSSPPCQMCRPIINDVIAATNPVECTCVFPTEVPREIQKVCKVENLKEGLENLKNRNHVLRNILKSCGCLSPTEDSSLSASPGEKETCECPRSQNHIKQTPSGLMCTVRLLQSKCRTKDGMIVALADELKKGATPEQTSRILEALADPMHLCHSGVSDFDRSELWNYLKNTKTRVSGRQTCHRDLFIGLIVLSLITLSHVVRSYYGLPPFPDVVNTFKYWMDEIPGNLGYLINVLADFARILFQKQCFVSLIQFLGPFSVYFEPIIELIRSLPGVRTITTLANIVSLHVESSCRTFALLTQSIRNLRTKFCIQLCRIVQYLNVFRRFMLFQRTHLPSLKAADLGDPEDDPYYETNCECRIYDNPKHPEPPRKLTVKARVSGDGLIISWLPPLSGPVAGYEIFAEGEIVGRIRTPLRTETFVGGLDLRGMVLLEVKTIGTNGLRSVTVEKLFNPARSDV